MKLSALFIATNLIEFSDLALWIGIGLVGGLLIAFLISGSMISSMNTAKRKRQADSYIRLGSLKMNQQNEMFLYEETKRTEKPKEKNQSK